MNENLNNTNKGNRRNLNCSGRCLGRVFSSLSSSGIFRPPGNQAHRMPTRGFKSHRVVRRKMVIFCKEAWCMFSFSIWNMPYQFLWEECYLWINTGHQRTMLLSESGLTGLSFWKGSPLALEASQWRLYLLTSPYIAEQSTDRTLMLFLLS